MKRKDLHVGDEVAVKIGYNVYRAWVLDFDWTESKYGMHRFHKAASKPGVAIAVKRWGDCQPDVVQLNAILSSWTDHEAAEAAKIAASAEAHRRAKAAATARAERWKALRDRLAPAVTLRDGYDRGAAFTAKRWGARKSVASGLSGQTYAIPTKPADVRYRLSLRDISRYVDDFARCASAHPHLHFLVTEIGCGLAGYQPTEIAPLFINCVQLLNVALPTSFWRVLS